MIDIRYLPALRIVVDHGFWGGGTCPEIEVRPTAATAAALARMGVRAEAGTGALTLWLREDGARSGPVDLPEPLAFWLRGASPEFAAVTDPGWRGGEAPGRIVTFAAAAPLGAASLIAGDGLALPRRPAVFSERLDGVDPGMQAQVMAPSDPAPVWSGTVAGDSVTVDLSGLPEGPYTLVARPAAALEFVLCLGLAAVPFGLLTLPKGRLSPVRDTDAAPSVRLRFSARALRWDYVVLTEDEADLAQARIDGGAFTFCTPSRQNIRGRKGWVFRSTAPIPLELARKGRAPFVLRPDHAGLPDEIALPLAGPANLARAEDGTEIFRIIAAL